MKNDSFKKTLDMIRQEYICTFLQRDVLKKNRIYKDKHKSKRCFVIGNGPSLSTQDLSLLKNEITFVMSGFWKHPIIEKWQPDYYCFADPVFFDGSNQTVDFFNALKTKIKDTIFFVPIFAKEIVEKNNLLPALSTSYVKFDRFLFKFKEKIDLSGSIFPPSCVSQMAIQLAIYMGCNPIFLLGLDHDWLAHRQMDRHFYPDNTIKNHPVMHGDLSRVSYREELEGCLRLWIIYEKLLSIANKNKIKIINVTNGSFLDVFERARYEDLFLR